MKKYDTSTMNFLNGGSLLNKVIELISDPLFTEEFKDSFTSSDIFYELVRRKEIRYKTNSPYVEISDIENEMNKIYSE